MSRGTRFDWFSTQAHFRGRSVTRKRLAVPYSRRLRIEPLEDRRLLAVVTVDTLDDSVNLGDGVTSLREAIFATNLVGGLDTIEFSAALTAGGPATIVLTQGELAITDSLTINGPSANLLTIDASGNDPTPDVNNGDGSRVFNIDDGTSALLTVAISGLTLTGGDVGGFNVGGGAIRTLEELTVIESTVSGNAAGVNATSGNNGGNGGGIYNGGHLTVTAGTISGNSTSGDGGAIWTIGTNSLVFITDSTLSGNSAGVDGGAISNGSGSVTVTNSTLSGNSALGTSSDGRGGAIWGSSNSHVTVIGSTINDNSARRSAGGIYKFGSGTLSVTNSSITNNRADADNDGIGDGGGIAGTNITVSNSTISGNSARAGGGIYNRTNLTLTGSTIDGNSASGRGGGIGGFFNSTNIINVIGSTISGNSAGLQGGGIGQTGSGSLNLINSTISGNSTAGNGGGILGTFRNLTVVASTISGNSASGRGGGIEHRDYGFGVTSNLTLTGSTISGNSAAVEGGGILVSATNNVLNHTIVAGNTIEAGAANDVTGSVQVAFSLLGVDMGATITDNGGNLIGTAAAPIDPRLGPLANNGGPTLTHALLADSPAINRGDLNAAAGVGGVPVFDQRGTPFGRVFNGRIDIGAFEYQAASDLNLVVDTLADESDGNYALGDLSFREAILLANTYPSTDSIHFAPALAGGTILLTMGELTITRNTSIIGLGASLLTIDASGNDPTPEVNNGDGSRVFNINDNTSTLRTVSISGLTLTGGDAAGAGGAIFVGENLTVADSVITGNATTSGQIAGGGGIYSRALTGPANTLTVRNSFITDNEAVNSEGGGIRKRFGSLVIDVSTISGNSAWEAGGGVSASESVFVTIRSSSISDNHAIGAANPYDGGGGLFLFRATTTITGSTISGNSTGVDGGGIYNYNGNLTATDSTISGNSTANGDGGGIFGRYGNLTITRSTVSGNMALSSEPYPYTHGGGIYHRGTSNHNLTVTASTIEGNSAIHGGGIWKRSSRLTVTDSTIRNNTALFGGGGIASLEGIETINRSTISNNSAAYIGGGIRSVSGSLTVTESTISGNSTANGDGGGIYSSNLRVINSTVSGNSAGRDGGGVFGFGLTISGSTISGNSALNDGGGVRGGGTGTVTSSTINGNSAGHSGGGMYFNFGYLTVTTSTISGNSASESGGGISNSWGTVTVSGSTVSDNSSGDSGGAIYSYGVTSVTLTKSTISGNSAGGHGGGIYVKDAYQRLEAMTVNDSTISGNSADGTGGGIWFRSSRSLAVTNSTLSGNTSTSGGGVYFLADGAATAAIRHSTIAFNSASGIGGGMTVFGGTLALDHTVLANNTATFGPDLTNLFGILDANYSLLGSNSGTALAEAPVGTPDANGNLVGGPVGGLINPLLGPLVDNGGPTLTHALFAGSPALDAGDPSAAPGVGTVPALDQRGAPFVRVFGSGIDIGAYERQTVPGLSLVVSMLADESDGNYSAGDFSLREAISLANGSVGTDTITFAAALTSGGPATILLTRGELRILDAVAIQGPGASLLTIDASGNDPTPNVNNGDGSRVFNIDDGTFTFLTVSIASLTLTGGDVFESGGGILTRENLTVTDSTISGNSVSGHGGGYTIGRGGGIYSNGNLSVAGSTISGNSVGGYGGGGGQGGGISIRYGSLTLTGSTISGNSATGSGGNDGYGGGIFQRFGNVTVTNSILSGNSAGEDGGAIRIRGGQLFVTTSTITDNTAGTNGGGIWGDFLVDVTSSTISGNSAGGSGGGILSSLIRVTDSTISNNSAGEFGGGTAGDLRLLTNSTISGNSAGRDGGGVWQSISSALDPTLTHSTIVGNSAAGSGGGIRAPYRMQLSHMIVAENTSGTGEANDVTGTMTLAFSLLGVSAGAIVTDNGGNLIGSAGLPIDPRLAPLADNGGPTATHALLSGSPAINAGSLTPFSPPTFDQRGAPYQRIRGGRIDMGAHERQDLTVAIQDVGSPRVVSVDGLTIHFSSAVTGLDLADLELSLNGGPNLLTGGQTLATNDNQTFLLGGLTAITAASGYYTLTLVASGSGIADASGGPLDAGDTTSWAMGRAKLGLTVNTLVDEMDGSLDDGDLSLRDALAAAAPGETIDFDASLDGGTILLTMGELSSTRSLSIDAALLPSGITIDASGNDPTPETNDGNGSRVLAFDDGNSLADSPVTIHGVTLTGGDTRGDGGAIYTRDTLTLTGGTILGNSAGLFGGGIRAFGSVTVDSSIIADNSAALSGGGIFTNGSVTVDSSTIASNLAISSSNSGQGGGGIRALGSVTVTSSTISDNLAGDSGGGIFAAGPVTVAASTVSGNSAREGGGISNYVNGIPSGTTTVTDSTISGNSAQFGGGIVGRNLIVINSTISGNSANSGGGIGAIGSAMVTSSTISGNSASEGGGIWVTGASSLTLISSTVSGNSANSRGGGIFSFSSVTVTNSTISANSAGGGVGGGIWAEYAPVTIRNSIVAGNSDTVGSPDLRPATGFLSIDYSLIGSNAGTGLAESPLTLPDANGNLIGGPALGILDPMLASLADNGGPTMTHALLPGSPAIDAGDPSASGVPQFDQRGTPFVRVFDGNAVPGARIDIGALESQPNPAAFYGDYNHDNVVDAADYTVWRNMLGSSVAAYSGADGNGDSMIDEDDYGVWKSHFGQTLPGAEGGSGANSATDLDEPAAPAVNIVGIDAPQANMRGSEAAYDGYLFPIGFVVDRLRGVGAPQKMRAFVPAMDRPPVDLLLAVLSATTARPRGEAIDEVAARDADGDRPNTLLAAVDRVFELL